MDEREPRAPNAVAFRAAPHASLLLVLAAGFVAAFAVPFALAAQSGGAGAKLKTVNVKARDGGFSLSAKSSPVGKVRFVVKNVGKKNHNFRIAGKKTPVLKPGKTARLTVMFKKAGRYAYVSTVAGDVRRGLKGMFRLTGVVKPATPGNAKAGKTVFVANCSVCHVLKAANAHGTIGPNLDRTKLAYATIKNVVTKGKTGKSGTMPPFKTTLTAKQIQDVTAFVYASTH
jgi:mono/diheme cytochrome c family protein